MADKQMENIQTEEETRPITGRRVVQAYSTNDRRNNVKKISFWIISFIAFVIVSNNGGTNQTSKKERRKKKLRKVAETIPDVDMQRLQQINNKLELNEKYDQLNNVHDDAFRDDGGNERDISLLNGFLDETYDLDKTMNKVVIDVDMAKEDEIDNNNSMLASSIQSMEDSIKYYLGGVFGHGDNEEDDDDDDDDAADFSSVSADVKLSEEQLDVIAKKISQRLEEDARKEFRLRADSIETEKVHEIEGVMSEDKRQHLDAKDIANDVHEAEAVVVEDLKDEIDMAANRVKESLPAKVKKIRNEVVEEVTGKKLDEIEEAKNRRRERKKALMKKFQEMQQKTKEAQRIKQQLKNQIKELQEHEGEYPDFSKGGLGFEAPLRHDEPGVHNMSSNKPKFVRPRDRQKMDDGVVYKQNPTVDEYNSKYPYGFRPNGVPKKRPFQAKPKYDERPRKRKKSARVESVDESKEEEEEVTVKERSREKYHRKGDASVSEDEEEGSVEEEEEEEEDDDDKASEE